jgi:hypothetical protein
MLGLQWYEGHYDRIDPSQNQRRRGACFAGFQWEHFRMGLEYFQTQDAVDGILSLRTGVADDVDLVPLGGQVVDGRGGSLTAAFRTANWDIFARELQVKPDVNSDDKGVKSHGLGTNYLFSDSLNLALFGELNEYGEAHAAGHRDTENIVFATRIIF